MAALAANVVKMPTPNSIIFKCHEYLVVCDAVTTSSKLSTAISHFGGEF
mgnify:CR=1 FL=1